MTTSTATHATGRPTRRWTRRHTLAITLIAGGAAALLALLPVTGEHTSAADAARWTTADTQPMHQDTPTAAALLFGAGTMLAATGSVLLRAAHKD